MNSIHQEILANLNVRYVLLKHESGYLIVDKLKGAMIVIDDPIINVQKLIERMLTSHVEVYNSTDQLPEAIEKPIRIAENPKTLPFFIKKIYDENKRETGCIISAITSELITNIDDKRRLESLLQDYAFTYLYPNEGLNIFSEVNTDTISIAVIKRINDLPYYFVDSTQIKILDR